MHRSYSGATKRCALRFEGQLTRHRLVSRCLGMPIPLGVPCRPVVAISLPSEQASNSQEVGATRKLFLGAIE